MRPAGQKKVLTRPVLTQSPFSTKDILARVAKPSDRHVKTSRVKTCHTFLKFSYVETRSSWHKR